MTISKSQRFEIFKRDGFTCQYWGLRPPDAVLEVDHIEPRAAGGSDDELNLVTSCWECNRGKGARQLRDIKPRPDADLAFLEAQQEIAEARRYLASLEQRQTVLLDVVTRLQDLWSDVSDLDWVPKDRVLLQMLNRYSAEIVEAAVRDVAPKIASGYIPGRTGAGQAWVKYMWAVMRNQEAETD